MKKHYALICRSCIALLFVVAGVQKLINFNDTASFIGSLGVPLPLIATIIVIIIEIPVALLFAWGYRTKRTGYALVAFTALATLIVHKDYFGADLVNVLKNIAIMGGLMAAISCTCGDCTVHTKKHEQ